MPNIAKRFYPEIQGIRAISIISVILFHLGFQTLSGGYVGVDVFFVISGFLITQMITSELAHGSFSLATFYKNRVVRLLPNLFLMVVASVVIGYLVLKPYNFMQYAKSLQFSAIYLTNMVFARQQDYFDMSREAKPLLHSWSLSIEEQFYLVFPILLMLLYKLKAHRIAVLMLIGIASFWVRYDYIQQNLPIEGFFSFAGRVWEFVIGALVALMPAALKDRFSAHEPLAILGLLLVAASLFFLGEGIPYSGLLLVIPCLATALLIVCSPGTRTGDWLSGKTLVFIGALSYSLYLWHWPLVVGVHNADFGWDHQVQTLVLLLLTVTVSYLAWKYVEEPFRNNREKLSGKFVATLTLSFAVFCVSVGGYVYANVGLENRFPAWVSVKKNLEAFDFQAATGTKVSYPAHCGVGDDPNSASLDFCSFGDLKSENRFLLLGDSHALASYPAFQAAAETMHAQGVLAAFGGCPPIFGVSSHDGARNICARSFDSKIDKLIETGSFKKVFLIAFWSMYTEGDPNNQPNHFISDAQTTSLDSASSKRVIARRLRETILRLNERGIEVIIVQSVPILPNVVQSLPIDFTQPFADIQRQNQFMNSFVSQWQGGGLRSLDSTLAFCDQHVCRTRDNGNVLYTDNNHLSPAGAALLINQIKTFL